MDFEEVGRDSSKAKSSEKKASLAKDEKIKSFWDTLVNEWLKSKASTPGQDNYKD